MTKRDKLLTKAKNNPDGLAFEEFEALLAACNWQFRRQSGSHRLWYSPRCCRLPIQNRGGKAKGYQVKQFLHVFDEEEGNVRRSF